MHAANHFRKENPVILRGKPVTKGQALHYAWWFENFRNKLSNGIYRFSYFKKDGSIREAVGTLNPELIPTDKMPVTDNPSPVTPNYSTFNYFDLSKNEWRSFRLDLFIGFIEDVSENYSSSRLFV